jgi:hypothetical protein
MDNTIIIQALVKAVKDGKMTLEQVPEAYRTEVESEVNGGE